MSNFCRRELNFLSWDGRLLVCRCSHEKYMSCISANSVVAAIGIDKEASAASLPKGSGSFEDPNHKDDVASSRTDGASVTMAPPPVSVPPLGHAPCGGKRVSLLMAVASRNSVSAVAEMIPTLLNRNPMFKPNSRYSLGMHGDVLNKYMQLL